MDSDALKISANRSQSEAKAKQSTSPQMAMSPTSVGDRPIPEKREVHDAKTYVAKKNYSDLSNNYSYRMQMQRQINKVRKH